jgi:hypothetical protein
MPHPSPTTPNKGMKFRVELKGKFGKTYSKECFFREGWK